MDNNIWSGLRIFYDPFYSSRYVSDRREIEKTYAQAFWRNMGVFYGDPATYSFVPAHDILHYV